MSWQLDIPTAITIAILVFHIIVSHVKNKHNIEQLQKDKDSLTETFEKELKAQAEENEYKRNVIKDSHEKDIKRLETKLRENQEKDDKRAETFYTKHNELPDVINGRVTKGIEPFRKEFLSFRAEYKEDKKLILEKIDKLSEYVHSSKSFALGESVGKGG